MGSEDTRDRACKACLRRADNDYGPCATTSTYQLSASLSASPASGASKIRVEGKVQEANLISKVDPVYPPLALQARIQGTVHFNATIAADGTIENLQVVSGHPILVQSALDAVKRWVYRPTLLNGAPVEVVTTINVDFALPPGK